MILPIFIDLLILQNVCSYISKNTFVLMWLKIFCERQFNKNIEIRINDTQSKISVIVQAQNHKIK